MEKKLNVKLLVKWLITLAVAGVIYFAIPRNDVITEPIVRFLAITLFGVFAWMFELLPAFIVGLMMSLGYILLKVSDAPTVFASWNNQIVWLCFSGLLVGAAFEKTGLLKRIAYTCIRAVGYSFKGIVIGLIASGIIISVLLPNLSARVVLYTFLGVGICAAMQLEKGSKAGAGIMLACFMAAVASRYILPSSNDEIVLASSLMKNPPSIMAHFSANIIPTLIWVAIMAGLILVAFKPKDAIDCKPYIDSEHQKMGKITAPEIKFLVLLLLAMVAVFTKVIGIGWCFLLLACICFFPGINILETKDMAKVNFPMIVFVATAMTIGNVTNALGLGEIVSGAFVTFLNGAQLSPYVLYPLCWLFGVIITMLMTPLAAVASFTVPLQGIAAAAGLGANGAIYAFSMGVEQIIFPYEWAAALFVFSFGYITSKQFLKWGAVRMLLCLVVLVAIMIPCWSLFKF